MMDEIALSALLEEITLRGLSLSDDRMVIEVVINMSEAVRYLNEFYDEDFCASNYMLITNVIY